MQKVIIIFILLVMLCGCWDARPMKDVQLGILAAYDIDHGRYKNSILIPNIQKSGSGPTQPSPAFIYSANGNTPSEARKNLDNKLRNTYGPSQLDVVLFSEKLAKQNIYPYLDAFYRDPRMHLDAVLGLVRGDAAKLISTAPKSEVEKSEYVEGILESLVNTTELEEVNVDTINKYIYESGIDFVTPILKKTEKNDEVSYEGMAIFSDNKYSGVDIPPRLCTLSLLMRGIKGDRALITAKIRDNESQNPKNYTTIFVEKLKASMKVRPNGKNIHVYFNTKLIVDIEEYPADDFTLDDIPKVKKELEESLTHQAEEIFELTKEANGDIFGVGRTLHAFHNDIWKQLNWKEDFRKVQMHADIEVKVRTRGIYKK
ncbi:germination protein, Ger(x)C family [Terribacillus saccharophilus]|uniref:Germination protein, Ger(X)C family n=1 Tax=Terribacillus saccharophilus TaxID=361277 RepID=A0AAX2EDP8_9BACI|nr:germination protein, Ger(x)C family [Terribacillus saccharophilus]